MFVRFLPAYHEADSDTGSGGDPTPAPKTKPSDLVEKYNGDALRMAEKLADVLNDNHGLREWKRTTATRLADLEGKVPTDGAVVLKGDDLARYQAYRELGEPDELSTIKAEREQFAADVARYRKAEQVTKAAQVAGYKADVLMDVGANVDYEIRTVDERGQKVERVYVKAGDAEAVPIEQHFQKLLPALVAEPRRGDGIGTPPRQPVAPIQPTTQATPSAPLVRL